jgi:hypothetical protein
MQPDRFCWTYAENWDSSKIDDTFEWDECILSTIFNHEQDDKLSELAQLYIHSKSTVKPGVVAIVAGIYPTLDGETPENSATRHFSHRHNMDIKNPRRILAIGAPEAGVLSLLKGAFCLLCFARIPLTLLRAHRFRSRASVRYHCRPYARMAT